VEVRKKKPSPSSLKRNAKRKEEFLTKPVVKPAMKPDVPIEEPLNRTVVKNHDLKEIQKPDSKNLKCDECDATFMTENGLWVHMEIMHTNTKHKEVVKCEYCPFRSSSSTFEFHAQMAH
jgi:hypothetical protein